MKHLKLFGISALSLVLLAACNQSTESSVGDTPPASSASTAQASTPVAAAQTIASKDGKISLSVTGQYADKLAEAGQLISDIPSEQLLFLQRDDAADVLLYAADLGKSKKDAATYLKNLSDAVKADAALKNATVGAVEGNKLAYQFSETQAETEVNQACVAINDGNIYSVCAISSSQAPAQLAQLLGNIAVK
ncbi:hypothetical protein LVJ82_06250 [Vitreoscilla massiliensis]|uniref:Lipoprotein n=1 Tax=Vitreoscilla massiliensis TaxID=1689272 RepID=A0ABY4E816_9NEIS|nr:hypothetical protein [Vitreoscilla massiliensis]UOO90573.1 hypothetical protein LVJ82_06250 [Vitreoscilla massiliensis]